MVQRARVLDGKALSQTVRDEVKAKVAQFSARTRTTPHLAVVLASSDPASAVYVRNKGRAADEVGIRTTQHTLPVETKKDALLSLVRELNRDDDVDGILVQLPLPDQHDEELVIRTIAPDKDVDGLHPENAGRLARGDEGGLMPCTPRGCIRLIEHAGTSLEGKHAVVVGRSRLVGRPVADLLLNRHATVTVCHSRTRELPRVVGRGDVVVAAVGRPLFIRGAWLKFGCTAIDVGINRNEAGKLVGDVDFAPASERAGALTPVPKGVGPMTIAYLLDNTVLAAERRRMVS